MHDTFTALGGMIPLINIQLGEIIVGGVGSGLYGMLLFVIIAIFVAGLMVGRTPEYVGKKIEANEVKMAMLAILVLPLMYLGWTAVAVLVPSAVASMNNPGPHGFTEVLYAYISQTGNNGSAFAGLTGNTLFYNLTAQSRWGRPVLDDRSDHGDCRLARRQKVDPAFGRNVADVFLVVKEALQNIVKHAQSDRSVAAHSSHQPGTAPGPRGQRQRLRAGAGRCPGGRLAQHASTHERSGRPMPDSNAGAGTKIILELP